MEKPVMLGGGGHSRVMLAALAALAAPLPSVPIVDLDPRDIKVPRFGWKPSRDRVKLSTRRGGRSASTLQLHGWYKPPCEPPVGYFWHRAPLGRQLYYLLKLAPGPRRVEYDEVYDRSIIWSGWGNVKPTYAPGDVR
jgi:hypothetical protein